MAELIYGALTSLDGYIADEAGNFDWAVPDEQVHSFINDLERPIGTYLYGRKMYETMASWETPDAIPDRTPAILDFARIWQAAEKIVTWSRFLADRPEETYNHERARFPDCTPDRRCHDRDGCRGYSRGHTGPGILAIRGSPPE